MTSRFNERVPNEQREEAGSDPGFFSEDSAGIGQFDMNARKYKQQQILLANRVEDLTKVVFWEARGKFSAVDYYLCRHNDPKNFVGSATVVPGIPMYWQKVDAQAELKYRTVESTRFQSTLIDSDKLMQLNVRSRDMNVDCYIIWAFQDCDMYYEVNPGAEFKVALGRNTQVTQDLPYEYKPQTFIPMTFLKVCSSEMFNPET